MRWPAKIKPATITDQPVCSIDFYPTFLEVAVTKNIAGNLLDGKSLVPLLTKNAVIQRDALFWHYPSETGKWKPRMASAVRKGDYKLLEFYLDKRVELYDLKKDPGEKNDLAATMADKVKALKQLLDRWRLDVKAEEPNLTAVNTNTD
jgi:arylsulfatase A-like enzyme